MAFVLGTTLMAAPITAFADETPEESIAKSLRSSGYVVDESGLLSSSDINALNEMAGKIYSKYKVGAYYVVVNSLLGYSDAQDYADALIDTYNLGNLTTGGCVVFLVCAQENQFVLVSDGAIEDVFPDNVLNYVVKDIKPYLSRSDWRGAGEVFFDDVRQVLKSSTASATSNSTSESNASNASNAASEVKYKGTYVTDNSGLFSDNERMQLEAAATTLAEQYNMGVYLLIVDYMLDSNGNKLSDPTSSQRTSFATDFYRANNLGLGKGNDGVMLTLAVKSRDYVTIGYGQGSYSFSNEGITYMEDVVTEYLGDNDWYQGCEAYYDCIGEQLEYYSVAGDTWTEPDILSLILKILATLGIPVGVAASVVSREKSAMKTAHEKTEANTYMVRDSFALTRSTDRFINTTMTVAPIPKVENSGGGHSFGGGGWGGGGGGGFSSSGGGKF